MLGAGSDVWQLAPYDGHGRLASETLSHGAFQRSIAIATTAHGRAIEMAGWDGKTLDSKARFSYGGNRMTSFEEHLACCGNYAVALAYDRGGRLASVTTSGRPPGSLKLGYDDHGRLTTTSRSQNNEELSLTYDSNLVSQIGTRHHHYAVRYTCSAKP